MQVNANSQSFSSLTSATIKWNFGDLTNYPYTYDSSTGIITVLYTGTYLFSVLTRLSNSLCTYTLGLQINTETPLVLADASYVNSSESWARGTLIAQLSANDTVKININTPLLSANMTSSTLLGLNQLF
jgi:hypothetical protein